MKDPNKITASKPNNVWTFILGIASVVVFGALFMSNPLDTRASIMLLPTDEGPRKVYVAASEDFALEQQKVNKWQCNSYPGY